MICRFIDTHCHFDFPPFSGDEEASLQRAAQAGVGKIIVPATEAENFARVQALAEKYQPLYAALGLHPGMLEKHSDVSLDQLQQALERRPAKVVAVGEIGLDLFGDDPQFERQQWLLDEQLETRNATIRRVIPHSFGAHTTTGRCIQTPRFIAHWRGYGFSGSLQHDRAVCTAGPNRRRRYVITYPRASKTRVVIAKLPLASLLLLETDAPDMSLNGFQGQPNRPNRLGAGVSTCFMSCAPEPEDEIAEVSALNNTYAVFKSPGSLPFVGSSIRSRHNAWMRRLSRLIMPGAPSEP